MHLYSALWFLQPSPGPAAYFAELNATGNVEIYVKNYQEFQEMKSGYDRILSIVLLPKWSPDPGPLVPIIPLKSHSKLPF